MYFRQCPCSAGPISQISQLQLQLLMGAPLTKVLLLQYGIANSSRLIGPAEQGEYKCADDRLNMAKVHILIRIFLLMKNG